MEKALLKEKRLSVRVLVSYLTIYLVWGSTYFFIKLAVESIPAFHVLALRFGAGGCFLLLLALAAGRLKKLPTLKETGSSLFLGLFLLLGGNGLVTAAEKNVDSYLASLVVSSIPLIVAFFDRLLLKKRISLAGIAGIFLGLAGVALLLAPGPSVRFTLHPSVLLLLAGCLSWSFATSLGHRIRTHADALVNSGIQMILIGLICTVILLFSPGTLFASFSLRSLLSVLYLAVIGSLAYVAYSYLIMHEPAIRVVSYAFVNPVIAVLIGLFIGREKPVPYLLPGVALIFTGLVMMLYSGPLIAYFRRRKGKAAGAGREAGHD